MKNQQSVEASDKFNPQNQGEPDNNNSKEPSVLDKLKDQIKKIKEIKEKGTGTEDHHTE
jgi:hypothetical protein